MCVQFFVLCQFVYVGRIPSCPAPPCSARHLFYYGDESLGFMRKRRGEISGDMELCSIKVVPCWYQLFYSCLSPVFVLSSEHEKCVLSLF